jgi:hypothetical protein
MEPADRYAYGHRSLAVPGQLLIFYAECGGSISLSPNADSLLSFAVIDPRNGAVLSSGEREADQRGIDLRGTGPRLLILTNS